MVCDKLRIAASARGLLSCRCAGKPAEQEPLEELEIEIEYDES